MKLPQDKKERQQILAVVGIFIAGILYAVWAFAYQPVLEKKSEAITKIQQLEDQIDSAKTQIRLLPSIRRNTQGVITNLLEISEKQMLQSQLGNYLISAREILGGQARILNIDPVQIDEVGLIAMPRSKDKGRPKPKSGDDQAPAPDVVAKTNAPAGPPPATIQAYTVRVTTSCGFDELRRWLALLEKDYAFAAVSGIMISAQPEDPVRHQITFEVQWPVWVDPDQREILQEKAQTTEAREGT